MSANFSARDAIICAVFVASSIGYIVSVSARAEEVHYNNVSPWVATVTRSADVVFDKVTDPWEDPLLTKPAILDSGGFLPGDTDTLHCSQNMLASKSSEPTPLSLADAIDIALCNNPHVKSTWAAIKAQAAAVGEARAAYFPTITIGISRLNDRTSYPGTDIPPNVLINNMANGNISWRLFDFGGRGADRHSANALLNAAQNSYEAELQSAMANTISAYFDALIGQEVWHIREKNEEVAQQILEAAQRRESRGVGARSDTLQATTALAKATLERSRALGDYKKALAVLVNALGVPANTPIVMTEDFGIPTDAENQKLDAWVDYAKLHHPAILAADAQVESAKNKVVVARSAGLPTIDVNGSYFRNGRPNQGLTPQTQETVVSLVLNVPIFDGFSTSYKIRGAEAQVEQKEADLRDTEQQVLMEIIKAHADASAASDNLLASQKLLNAAQAALESVKRKFDHGAADISEILNTQAALTDAQQEKVRCSADWNGSRLRLLAAAGALGHSDIAAVRSSVEH